MGSSLWLPVIDDGRGKRNVVGADLGALAGSKPYPIGNASDRFTWPSAKLVSMEATLSRRVSLSLRKRSAEYRDRGRRFVGIFGTTTLRAAVRTYDSGHSFEARSVDEALSAFRNGDADAIALSEDYLRTVQPQFPGSVVMADAFQETSISIAGGKQRPAALAFVGGFLEEAKATGRVRAIFDRHGLAGEPVALAGT